MATHKGTMAIALLDILGFRALMAEMEPEELYEATLGHFDTMMQRSTSLPLWTNNPLGSAAFSDTLFLWLQASARDGGAPDGFACVQDLVLVARGLLQRGMRRRIPLRGAIAYGECFVSDAPMAFIGKPILEAYELERRQQWSGVALCTSAEEQLGDLANMAPWPHTPVIRYPVPVKPGQTENLLALTWPNAFDLPSPTEAMRPARADAPDALRADVQEKTHNTSVFYERFKSRFQPYIDGDGKLVLAEYIVPKDGPEESQS